MPRAKKLVHLDEKLSLRKFVNVLVKEVPDFSKWAKQDLASTKEQTLACWWGFVEDWAEAKYEALTNTVTSDEKDEEAE